MLKITGKKIFTFYLFFCVYLNLWVDSMKPSLLFSNFVQSITERSVFHSDYFDQILSNELIFWLIGILITQNLNYKKKP